MNIDKSKVMKWATSKTQELLGHGPANIKISTCKNVLTFKVIGFMSKIEREAMENLPELEASYTQIYNTFYFKHDDSFEKELFVLLGRKPADIELEYHLIDNLLICRCVVDEIIA